MIKQSLIAYLTIIVSALTVGNASASVVPLLTTGGGPITYGTPTFIGGISNGTPGTGAINAAIFGSGFNVSGDSTFTVNSNGSFGFGYEVTQVISNVPAGAYYVSENLGIELVSGTAGGEKIDSSATNTYMNSSLQPNGGGSAYGTASLAYGGGQTLPQTNLGGAAASSLFTLTAGTYELVQNFEITIDNATAGETITLDLPNPSQLDVVPEPASFVVWGLLAAGFCVAGVRCHRQVPKAPML